MSVNACRESVLAYAIAAGNVEVVDRLTNVGVIVTHSGITRVIHMKDRKNTSQEVYIGRPGKGIEGPFGNPIRRGRTCIVCTKSHVEKRDLVLCYQRWLSRCLAVNPDFRLKVKDLAGKTLVCFCKPNLCHGDVLARVAELLAEIVSAGKEERDEQLDSEDHYSSALTSSGSL